MIPHLRVLLLAVAIITAAACQSVNDDANPSPDAAAPTKSTMDEATKRAEADRILGELLAGMAEQDYTKFIACHIPERRTQINREQFLKMAQAIANDLGEYQQREYLGRLDKQILDIFLWKARFSKTDEDALLRLMLGEVDGRYQVFSFSIAPY